MSETQLEHKMQEFDGYEDEIQLMDYLEVLWKWKYLILIVTLLCAGIGAFVSFQMKKIYRVSTVLEPGIVHLDQNGRVVRTCRGDELRSLIDTGALNGRVLADLKSKGVPDLPLALGFDVEQPKKSDIVEVTYDTPNSEMGVQVLAGLNEAVLKNFSGLVNRWKQQYATQLTAKRGASSALVQRIVRRKNSISSAKVENAIKASQIEAKISMSETRIAKLESEKKAQLGRKDNDIRISHTEMETKKKEIVSLEERMHDVKEEIQRIGENTDRLIKERDKFLSNKGGDQGNFASVMYVTTVQQNMAYANDLRSTINDLNQQAFQKALGIEQLKKQIQDIELEKGKLEENTEYNIKDLKMDIRDNQNEMNSLKKGLEIEIGNMESEIKALESERDSVNEEIKQLELKRSDTENIQIRKRPTADVNPVKPKILLNILLSLVIGLFLSLFVAFFLEALSKRKSGKDQ